MTRAFQTQISFRLENVRRGAELTADSIALSSGLLSAVHFTLTSLSIELDLTLRLAFLASAGSPPGFEFLKRAAETHGLRQLTGHNFRGLVPVAGNATDDGLVGADDAALNQIDSPRRGWCRPRCR